METDYEKTRDKLHSIFIIELACMKSGIKKINKNLLLSYLRVIKDLEKRIEEEKIENIKEEVE